jgi:hypothetical protein
MPKESPMRITLSPERRTMLLRAIKEHFPGRVRRAAE